LEGVGVWWFEGELKAGIVTAIGEGIIKGINALEAHAKRAIDDAEKKIVSRLSVLHDDMGRMKQELDELRLKSREAVAKRRDEIEKQNRSLRRALDEIDELDRRYREVKSRKDSKEEFRCGKEGVGVEKHVPAEMGQLPLVGESVLGEFETFQGSHCKHGSRCGANTKLCRASS
jgi:hypothetical protein